MGNSTSKLKQNSLRKTVALPSLNNGHLLKGNVIYPQKGKMI